MRARAYLLVAPMLVLSTLDVAVKATVATPPDAFHQRSLAWVLLSGALLLAVASLVYVPSGAVAFAAGTTAGGILGNLESARWHDDRVPNPFLLTVGGGPDTIAFNLADVCIVVGLVLLMATLVDVSIRHRSRLIPPRRWERALRERLVGAREDV